MSAVVHRCNVTYRVPLKTESGREVSAIEIPCEVEFTDRELEAGMFTTTVLHVTCAGRAFDLPVAYPLAELADLEAVTATVTGLLMHPQKTIEIERDKNNRLVSRTYPA
jgi:hypothetical protein